jgi:hypothetical protein
MISHLENGDGLNADSECLDIQFGNKQMEASSLSTTELENVIDFIYLEDNKGDIQQQQYPTESFCSTTDNGQSYLWVSPAQDW